MRRTVLWIHCGVAAITAAMSLASAGSFPLPASVRAAYRAFCNPALLDARPPPAPSVSPAPPPPRPAACPTGTDAPRPLFTSVVARALEGEGGDHDGPDRDDAELEALTRPDLEIPITRRTMRYLRFYARTEAGRRVFLSRYHRAARYRDYIEDALREAGLPQDLVWLPAIESGYDAHAVSPVGASGLWQFMPETAAAYGLVQSPLIDERNSVPRETQAAVRHLHDLHERFGRWDLALAAYNAGGGRVESAMGRLTQQASPPGGAPPEVAFASLAAARLLPDETANYVPQIMAFALVAANASELGLDGQDPPPSLNIGEISVPEGTHLETIAHAAGVTLDVVRDYNPQLLGERVPPTGGEYRIALPADHVERARAAFPAFYDHEVIGEQGAEEDEKASSDPDESSAPAAPVDAHASRASLPVSSALARAGDPGVSGDDPGAASTANAPRATGAPAPNDLSSPRPAAREAADGPRSIGGRDGATPPVTGPIPPQERSIAPGGPAQRALEALRTVTLSNGILLRTRHDATAQLARITVRVATLDEAGAGGARNGAGGASESAQTILVSPSYLAAGLELAAVRLRLLLGDADRSSLTEVRKRAGAARRRALEKAPYGAAWLALGNALFPPGHPLAGTVLGASEDPDALGLLLVADLLQAERSFARASITVVGDIDESAARRLAQASLGNVSLPVDLPLTSPGHQQRVFVDESTRGPRVLFGWLAPAEGEEDDASLRVLVQILENPGLARLRQALVERDGVASFARAGLEIGRRASVMTLDLAPAPGREVSDVERLLDAELLRLADQGPTPSDVFLARSIVRADLEEELAAEATADAPAGSPLHRPSIAALRHALQPNLASSLRKSVDEVTVDSIKAAIRNVLVRDHRVVVVSAPGPRGGNGHLAVK